MLRATLAVVAILGLSAPALAQKINVKSATPSQGAQATVNLDVVIDGSGFGPGAQARFVLSGTDNPDGIIVKSTRVASSSQLVATIDIADTASLAHFDIKVTLSGRSGKGTDLFQVVEKVLACEAGVYKLPFSVRQLDAWPSDLGCGIGAGGTLDCGFGQNGKVMTSALSPPAVNAIDLAVGPNGTLYVLAEARPEGVASNTAASSFYVLRFTADGALDTSFGQAGVASVVFAGIGWERPQSMVLQPDGRIVVAGFYQTNRGGKYLGGIARFLPSGVLDSTFGTAGRVTLSFGSQGSAYPHGIVHQTDGKLVVSAYFNGSFGVVRLLDTGALDASFGSGGKAVVAMSVANVGRVALQYIGGEERIVLSGSAQSCPQALHPSMVAVRLRPNGTLDASFGPYGSGVTFVDIENGGTAEDIAVDALGRLLIGGYWRGATALVRLDRDGLLDTTFGDGGGVLTQVRSLGAGHTSVTLDEAGRIVTAGWHSVSSSNREFLVQRYLADGTLDTAFGLNGVVTTAFEGGTFGNVNRSVKVQPGGRVIVVGTAGGATAGQQLISLAGYVP